MLRGMVSRRLCSHAFFAALALGLGVAPLGCGSDEAPAELHIDLTPGQEIEGREEIRGTVTFPTSVPAGRVARLQVKRSRPMSYADADATAATRASLPATKLTFTIRRIAAREYTLFAWVDLDGDDRLGPGDLAGYFAGATTAPVQQPAAAQVLSAQNVVTADFGIGPL
jgi:hypothetical protein